MFYVLTKVFLEQLNIYATACWDDKLGIAQWNGYIKAGKWSN